MAISYCPKCDGRMSTHETVCRHCGFDIRRDTPGLLAELERDRAALEAQIARQAAPSLLMTMVQATPRQKGWLYFEVLKALWTSKWWWAGILLYTTCWWPHENPLRLALAFVFLGAVFFPVGGAIWLFSGAHEITKNGYTRRS